MIDCKHASQLVSQSMDKPLAWRQRLSLWIHLAICGMCRQFVGQLRLMRVTLKRMLHVAENDETIKLSDDAKRRIQEVLNKQP